MREPTKVDLEVVAMRRAGARIMDIAVECRICETSVQNIIHMFAPELIKKRTCWSYSEELKQRARQMFLQGMSQLDISRSLNVPLSSIGNWTRGVRGDQMRKATPRRVSWKKEPQAPKPPNPNAWQPSGFIAELPKSKLMAGR